MLCTRSAVRLSLSHDGHDSGSLVTSDGIMQVLPNAAYGTSNIHPTCLTTCHVSVHFTRDDTKLTQLAGNISSWFLNSPKS